jgi:23S rRNA pseudouridine2605 synthase
MCEAIGHDVMRLVRTRIGPITDAKLAPGAFRNLSMGEVRKLMESVKAIPEAESTMGL